MARLSFNEDKPVSTIEIVDSARTAVHESQINKPPSETQNAD